MLKELKGSQVPDQDLVVLRSQQLRETLGLLGLVQLKRSTQSCSRSHPLEPRPDTRGPLWCQDENHENGSVSFETKRSDSKLDLDGPFLTWSELD